MLRGKFAVIKFWPDVKAAEDEVIARLIIAAHSLGLECIVVDAFARLLHPPHTQLTQDDVDFVLSLHFLAPKRFDIFSFVTLWNPLRFYHDWGYSKFTRHLLSHDDFLSCDSISGDDHVMRSASRASRRERPLFRFYPTISEPILEPTLGDQKLCYLGINWERLSQKPGRHEGLLGLLDLGSDLRIYGPRIYAGVQVWCGFKSYVGPIPFDGVSVVRLIHMSGISLVLSSPEHRESEMMSCRIFESAAAGAVIICDENPFARRHFGDSLLYIDASLPPEEMYGQVQSHLNWIKSEPKKALALAKAAQDIFLQNFKLDSCLERMYEGLTARKQELESLYTPAEDEEICVVFLMPEFRPDVLEQHIANCLAQRNVRIRGILAMDARDVELFGPRVQGRISESSAPLEIAPVHYVERRPDGSKRRRKPLGEVLNKLIGGLGQGDYVCIVAPHERIFSDHICSLLRILQDAPDAGCAWSEMLLEHGPVDREQAALCDDPDARVVAEDSPIGFGRFLFRVSDIDQRIYATLPYLDARAMHLLFGASKNVPTRRCTMVSARADGAGKPDHTVPADMERDILLDFSPEVFQPKHLQPAVPPPAVPPLAASEPPAPISVQLAGMTQEERTKFAVELAHTVPFPSFVKRMVFGMYRLWFRMHR